MQILFPAFEENVFTNANYESNVVIYWVLVALGSESVIQNKQISVLQIPWIYSVEGVFRLRNVNTVGFYYLFNCANSAIRSSSGTHIFLGITLLTADPLVLGKCVSEDGRMTETYSAVK
jgi:hypothetical protein